MTSPTALEDYRRGYRAGFAAGKAAAEKEASAKRPTLPEHHCVKRPLIALARPCRCNYCFMCA